MNWLFWSSVAIIAYTYFGYPAWLWLRRTWKSAPLQPASFLPSISIVVGVRNEASILERKLQTLLALDYPAELCERIIVSGGSSDATEQVLRERAASGIRPIVLPGLLARGADAAFTFVLLNVAALVAFGKFVRGRKPARTR